MEDAGDVGAEESSMYDNHVKNKLDTIKQLNGIVGKDDILGIKRNGDILKHTDSADTKKELLEEPTQDSKNHLGNGDSNLLDNDLTTDKKVKDMNDESKLVTDNKSDEIQDVNLESLQDVDKKENISDNIKEEQTSLLLNKDTDIKPKIEIIAENVTDIKSDATTLSESIKFKLNDKIRNSLKGLQDKVKSFPDKQDGESSRSSNGTECSTPNNIIEESSRSAPEENGHDDVQSKETVPNCEDHTSLILDSGKENGIESVRNDTVSEQNNKDEDDVLLEDTSDDIPMEIGSDDERNEDDLLEITSESTQNKDFKCEKLKPSPSNINENVQFDDDSNSNSTSAGKVSEIVNFLDADVSNTPSPLTVEQKKEQEVTEVKTGSETSNENCSKENECPDDSSPKQDLTSESSKTSESNIENSKSNSEDNLSKLNTGINQEKEPVETPAIESTPPPVLNISKDDTDDDVIICDSITKEENQSNKTEPAIENKNNKIESSIEEKSAIEEDDDDVIFEKEVKSSANTNDNKQICDTKQTNVTKKPDVELDKTVDDNDATKNIDTKTEAQDSEDCIIQNSDGQNTEKENNKLQQTDRKRPAENDSEPIENEAKRSKLDLSGLIGKLGTRVQPVELTDSDEEEESEDMDTASQITEKESMDSETETKNDKSEKDKNKYRTITEKELQEIVQKKVKEYLTAQRDTLLIQLSQKVKELQLSNDLWKKQVKDLQVKVNDVTVLQQKLEERKAKTDALRQITKRSVGLQVEDGRDMMDKKDKKWVEQDKKLTSSGTTNPGLRERLAAAKASPTTAGKLLASSQSKSQATTKSSVVKTDPVPVTKVIHAATPVVTALPGSNGTIRLPIPQSSQPLLNQHFTPAQMNKTYRPPSVKSLLDTTRKQPTISSTPVTPPTTTPTSVISLVQLPRLMSPPTTQGYVTVSQVGQPVSKVVSKPTAGGGVTTIDLTDDEDGAKTRLLTIPANAINTPGGVQMLPPGTQLIRHPGPNAQYQFVFNSSSPGIRPTMVPGGVSTMPHTGATILKTLPNTNVVTLSSPPGLAPGMPMPRASMIHLPTAPLQTPLPPPVPPKTITMVNTTQTPSLSSHPAPFPPLPLSQDNKAKLPPKPILKISRVTQGIVLSWNMSSTDSQAEISSYQLFAYQETQTPPSTSLWKKVGDVKALPLPMACTLTQFQVGNKYHFAVRAMDNKSRVGHFSDPSSIHLTVTTTTV